MGNEIFLRRKPLILVLAVMPKQNGVKILSYIHVMKTRILWMSILKICVAVPKIFHLGLQVLP